MSSHVVDPPARGDALSRVRERKRRELRQNLSDTATAMFLEHGFDHVRVSDIAAACGVSTKTVWNHFPSKEALLFDRGERLAEVLRDAADRPTDLLGEVVECIREEIDRLEPADSGDHGGAAGPAAARDAIRTVHAFVLLNQDSPSLRAATADRLEQLTRLAAAALSAQNGEPASSPRNEVSAAALVSLWRVHLSALLRLTDSSRSLAEVKRDAFAEVQAGRDLVAQLLTAPDRTA